MAVADILSTIRGFVTTSSKSQNEFKNESTKNNRNISDAIRDISRMFSSQRSINQKNEGSLSEVLGLSQETSRTTQQNNDLLKESISLQTNMLQELKKINTGVNSLLESFEASGINQQGQDQSAFSREKLMMAGAALGAVTPGLVNNFFGKDAAIGSHLGGGNQSGGTFSALGGGQNTPGNNMKVDELTQLAKEAGFNDQEARIMAAIAASESGGNPTAHNPDASTGDNSYGLWQINMLGKMGPERRDKFGIQNDEELFDPKVNAKAAYIIYKEQGFNAWSDYKNNKYVNYLPEGDDKNVINSGNPAEQNYYANKGLYPQETPSGASSYGRVNEEQGSRAAIRKQPINDKLKQVLEKAAAAAQVDVVVHSGGQPSKESGKGPRTGSTRHDDGNAADLYLMRDGKILRDPEDRETMAKFVAAATDAGATGVGFGGEGKYMGASSIHVGFGRPATWGGSPWIAQAASGVYRNEDLASSGGGEGGLGGAMSNMAANAMTSLDAAFRFFGMENVNTSNLLSSIFGIPFIGADVTKDAQGKETYGSVTEEEAEEGTDSSFDPIASPKQTTEPQIPGRDSSSSNQQQTSEPDKQVKGRQPEKDDKGFINYDKFGNMADQIKQAATNMSSNPIVIKGSVPNMSPNSTEQEFPTDFGATDSQPRNTRASWAPRVAVLRPDEKVTESIRWAARISPNLMT